MVVKDRSNSRGLIAKSERAISARLPDEQALGVPDPESRPGAAVWTRAVSTRGRMGNYLISNDKVPRVNRIETLVNGALQPAPPAATRQITAPHPPTDAGPKAFSASRGPGPHG